MTAGEGGEAVMRPWQQLIPEADRAASARAGFGRSAGFGERPALLVIDVQYRTVGEPQGWVDQGVETYKTACAAGWAAVPHIARLIGAFRRRGAPVIFPHVAPKLAYDAGRLAQKVPEIMAIDERGYHFVAEVAPEPGEILVPKRHPSAFFATSLASYLIDGRVDTVVLAGCTTSGCIRASAVDAFSYNLRVAVADEAVYDRSDLVHAVNLFDISAKYGDVLGVEAVLDRLG